MTTTPPATARRTSEWARLRWIGAALVAVGLASLVGLHSPWRDWFLEHQIAHLVSAADRRVGNSPQGAGDPVMAHVGAAMAVFVGAWIAVVVPAVIDRHWRRQREAAGLAG